MDKYNIPKFSLYLTQNCTAWRQHNSVYHDIRTFRDLR